MDGMIMLLLILKQYDGRDMVWTNLAQDRKKWWALLNTVMNFYLPQNANNFSTS
jgi:hypothetical protein